MSNDNADQTIEQPGWRPAEAAHDVADQVVRPMVSEDGVGHLGVTPPPPPIVGEAASAVGGAVDHAEAEAHGFFDTLKARLMDAEETLKADVGGIVGDHRPEVAADAAAHPVVSPITAPVVPEVAMPAAPQVAAPVVPAAAMPAMPPSPPAAPVVPEVAAPAVAQVAAPVVPQVASPVVPAAAMPAVSPASPAAAVVGEAVDHAATESHGFFDAIKAKLTDAEETVKADVAGIVGDHKPEAPVTEAADAIVRPVVAAPVVPEVAVPDVTPPTVPVVAPAVPEPTMPLTAAEPTVPLAAEPTPDTAIREAERAAREKMLGTVAPAEDDGQVPQLVRHDNDKLVGSFGLFWLRLVAGAVVGVRAALMLIHVGRTTDWLRGLSVPYPDVIAWAAPIVLLIVAALLVIGFGTRTGGVIVALYAIALLVFVQWGPFNIFQGGPIGDFIGEFELLLAGVGVALAFLGGGGWSIDGHRRLVRAKRKLYS